MNNQLEELNIQLEEMGGSKRLMVYVVIFCAFVYMSWTMFGEDMSMEISAKEERIASLQAKLLKNSNRSLQSAIVRTKKKNLSLQDALNHLHFQKQFIQTKLQSIDFIFYSEEGSAQLLDKILKSSLKNAIDLQYIVKESLEAEAIKHIAPKSRLLVNGIAPLGSVVRLQHYIESLNTLVDTKSLFVELDENNATHFELELIHYGAEI